MAEYDFDIGILGGGSAGLTVASGAAQLGAKTLLIEKENKLGGDCLHYGCVPSKTLIRSAQVYHLMKNTQGFGLPSVKIPPVDFRHLAKRIKSVIDIIQKHDSEERFCGLGVKVVFGNARFVDEHTVELEGSSITAKTWVVATGSSPVVPSIEGLNETHFITNKEIFYLEKLPPSMIILGGGPIGIEMAQAFTRLGTRVTVIEKGSRILSKEDKDMADDVMEILQTEGVNFRLNSTVLSTKNNANEREVLLQDSNGSNSKLKADTLLVATGRKAETEGLGLEDIGVKLYKRGIKTDARLRTDQKNIYAAGDVNGKYQFTHAAGYEGGIVITNAIFHLPRKAVYDKLPWCTYTDPELASIGMNESRAKTENIEYKVYTEYFKDNDRSLAEGQKTGKIKMILDKKENPIGIQILGPHAGELLNEWVAVFNGKVKLSTLAGAVHPYPTLAEINKKTAGAFISKKLFSDKIKKGLKFFFNLKGRACSTD